LVKAATLSTYREGGYRAVVPFKVVELHLRIDFSRGISTRFGGPVGSVIS